MKSVNYAVLTKSGSREINEDSIGVFHRDNSYCCVLCDGLGGHGMGDKASALVVSTFESYFQKNMQPEQFMAEAFSDAQEILMEEQKRLRATRKMKTTAVSLVIDGHKAYIGHIGDSRLYVFNRNKVKTRTLDHSIPQMLALAGDIKDSEIRFHQDRNVVLRVMGVEWEKPMYEFMKPIPLWRCQAFLLCSDGFWELIEEDKMCETLKNAGTVDEWLSLMTDIVEKNGIGKEMDNYSAIAVWCR